MDVEIDCGRAAAQRSLADRERQAVHHVNERDDAGGDAAGGVKLAIDRHAFVRRSNAKFSEQRARKPMTASGAPFEHPRRREQERSVGLVAGPDQRLHDRDGSRDPIKRPEHPPSGDAKDELKADNKPHRAG